MEPSANKFRAEAIEQFKVQMLPLLSIFAIFTMWFANQPTKFLISILIQYPVIIVLHRIATSAPFIQKMDKWSILLVHLFRVCLNEAFLVYSTVLGGSNTPVWIFNVFYITFCAFTFTMVVTLLLTNFVGDR